MVHDTLERLTAGRDNTERRPGSRKVAYFFAVVPVHPDDEIDD